MIDVRGVLEVIEFYGKFLSIGGWRGGYEIGLFLWLFFFWVSDMKLFEILLSFLIGKVLLFLIEDFFYCSLWKDDYC